MNTQSLFPFFIILTVTGREVQASTNVRCDVRDTIRNFQIKDVVKSNTTWYTAFRSDKRAAGLSCITYKTMTIESDGGFIEVVSTTSQGAPKADYYSGTFLTLEYTDTHYTPRTLMHMKNMPDFTPFGYVTVGFVYKGCAVLVFCLDKDGGSTSYVDLVLTERPTTYDEMDQKHNHCLLSFVETSLQLIDRDKILCR